MIGKWSRAKICPRKRKRPDSVKSHRTLVRTALPRSLLKDNSTLSPLVWEWHERVVPCGKW